LPFTGPFATAREPNDVWCADLKGWFRAHNGERCEPLTISDAASRFAVRCTLLEETTTPAVQAVFTATFEEYGLPRAIRTHNGPPFASHALFCLTRLAVWWIKRGRRGPAPAHAHGPAGSVRSVRPRLRPRAPSCGAGQPHAGRRLPVVPAPLSRPRRGVRVPRRLRRPHGAGRRAPHVADPCARSKLLLGL